MCASLHTPLVPTKTGAPGAGSDAGAVRCLALPNSPPASRLARRPACLSRHALVAASARLTVGERPKVVAHSLHIERTTLIDRLKRGGLPYHWGRPDDILSPIQRRAWDMAERGMSRPEIARRLDSTPASIRAQLYQARQKLGLRGYRFPQSALTGQQQRIVALSVAGVACESIAERVGLTAENVSVTLSNGRKRLGVQVERGAGYRDRLRDATRRAVQSLNR
jgi:DNA-binding CsgD family transcriptional regulator